MEGTLKVTPELLMNTATTFGSCGTAVRNITSGMMEIVNGLNSVFTGEDATAYVAKFNGLQDDISKMDARIQEHVTDLNEMARVYASATSANVTAAEGLSSDVLV